MSEQSTQRKRLPIDGTHNIRDIGGYIGKGGRKVKMGLLYRGDQLSKVTDQGIEEFKKLNINTIIDLRSPPEIKKSPNQYCGEQKTIHCDPSAETAELAASFQVSAQDEDRMLVEKIKQRVEQSDNGESMYAQYRKFASHPKCIDAFKRLMLEVSKEDSAPLFFHCRGGKDRTGFAAMLILGTLGVSDEDIIRDYLITKENRAQRTQEKMESYRQYTDDQAVLTYLESLLDTAPDFIDASLKELKSNYNSVEQYVKEVLDLDEKAIKRIQDIYLEES
ncbi:protein-tyrosine phosphatase [Aequitasia blattaphilus]|uniref:Tyrosine-protein phosphatase n=1 Tax=Aequitasia blattaphilus TaxID=2949332 RepID=A0ABT1EBB1_9FIRM|nr:tyrosine-protein phosphatase [Aequitasia blattaphilus]MCP1103125.1 tyrosine-protein phosphatase [Aequitasia blattaphilus]MCR8615765.1 tyrosine-protein phosphatase [Aequitasia blattaphilus]